jgi:hypothetical protein
MGQVRRKFISFAFTRLTEFSVETGLDKKFPFAKKCIQSGPETDSTTFSSLVIPKRGFIARAIRFLPAARKSRFLPTLRHGSV